MGTDEPTTTLPAGLEAVWLVEATYAPDAAETRVPFRAEHLAGMQRRLAAGVYVEAGAFADVSASVILVRAAGEAEALAIVGDDRTPAQRRLGGAPRPPIRSGRHTGRRTSLRSSRAAAPSRRWTAANPSAPSRPSSTASRTPAR